MSLLPLACSDVTSRVVDLRAPCQTAVITLLLNDPSCASLRRDVSQAPTLPSSFLRQLRSHRRLLDPSCRAQVVANVTSFAVYTGLPLFPFVAPHPGVVLFIGPPVVDLSPEYVALWSFLCCCGYCVIVWLLWLLWFVWLLCGCGTCVWLCVGVWVCGCGCVELWVWKLRGDGSWAHRACGWYPQAHRQRNRAHRHCCATWWRAAVQQRPHHGPQVWLGATLGDRCATIIACVDQCRYLPTNFVVRVCTFACLLAFVHTAGATHELAMYRICRSRANSRHGNDDRTWLVARRVVWLQRWLRLTWRGALSQGVCGSFNSACGRRWR